MSRACNINQSINQSVLPRSDRTADRQTSYLIQRLNVRTAREVGSSSRWATRRSVKQSQRVFCSVIVRSVSGVCLAGWLAGVNGWLVHPGRSAACLAEVDRTLATCVRSRPCVRYVSVMRPSRYVGRYPRPDTLPTKGGRREQRGLRTSPFQQGK